MSVQVTRWFVEPLDSTSNRAVADLLEHKGIADRDANPQIECDDGQARALWECPHDVITQLCHERESLNLRVRFWRAQGNGKPRRWGANDRPVGAKPKRKQPAA